MAKTTTTPKPEQGSTEVTGQSPEETPKRLVAYLLNPTFKTKLKSLFKRHSKGKDKDNGKGGGVQTVLRVIGK